MRRWSPVALMLCAGCTATVGSELKKFGYAELEPPSTLQPPGTIISVEDPGSAVVAQTVCQASNALGDVKINESNTATSKVSQALTGSFNASANVLTQANTAIAAKVNGNVVTKLTITLSNTMELDLPVDEVFKNAASFPNARCRRAIDYALKQGRKLSLVTRVLRADVTCTIDYSSDVQSSAQADLTKLIAANLGFEVKTTTERTVSGTGLFWGIREDCGFFAAEKPSDFRWIAPAAGLGSDPKTSHVAIPLIRAEAKVISKEEAAVP